MGLPRLVSDPKIGVNLLAKRALLHATGLLKADTCRDSGACIAFCPECREGSYSLGGRLPAPLEEHKLVFESLRRGC